MIRGSGPFSKLSWIWVFTLLPPMLYTDLMLSAYFTGVNAGVNVERQEGTKNWKTYRWWRANRGFGMTGLTN